MSTDDELAETLTELTEAIRDLETQLAADSESRGVDRRLDERIDRTTDDLAIEAAIVALEANVRTLRGLQRGLRFVQRARRSDDSASSPIERRSADRPLDRLVRLRDRTVEGLDSLLEEVQRPAPARDRSDADAPVDLVDDVRDVREQVDRRPDRITEPGDGPEVRTIEIDDGTEAGEPDHPAPDVDAELETLREQYGPESSRDSSAVTGGGYVDDDAVIDDAGEVTGTDGEAGSDDDSPDDSTD